MAKKTVQKRAAATNQPRNEGHVDEAEAQPADTANALAGMTFVITGTLDGLDRKQGHALIEKHGGKIVKSLKDKPTYVLMGVKPGPAKVKEVEEEQLEVLSQKEMMRLIDGKKGDDGQSENDDDQDALSGPPDGAANALEDLSFLITGTLDGLDRKQGTALIYRHGGTLASSLDQKPDYVVVGVKPGPKKIEEIERSGLKTLSQRQLYDLIRTRKGSRGKSAVAKQSGAKKRAADDTGAEEEEEDKPLSQTKRRR